MTQSDNISAGDITDGSVVAIGRDATATLTEIENQNFYTISETEEIDIGSIQCYLKQMKQPFALPSEDSEVMRTFFWLDFYTHRLGDVNIERDNLWHSVKRQLDQQRDLAQNQQLVILAEAGMGKTPALKYLQRWQAESTLESEYHHKEDPPTGSNNPPTEYTFIVPILIDLADLLYSDLDLLDLAQDAFNHGLSLAKTSHKGQPSSAQEPINSAQTIDLLQNYVCLFLLDGLDILIASSHKHAIQKIRRFMSKYNQDQFIISCRTANYHQQLGLIDILMLDDLNEKELKTVLGSARYGTLNRTLRQLARNRALLEIIIKLDHKAVCLVSKGQLFEQLIALDLKERGKDKLEIDADMAEDLLEQLAYSMLVDGVQRYNEFQVMKIVKQYLREWDEPYSWRKVVSELRKIGILQRDKERHWKFVERTHAAYFTAAAIAQKPDTRLEPILSCANDPALIEILELLTGLLQNPAQFFDALLDKKYVLVAAHCLQFTCNPRNKAIMERLIQALVKRIDNEHTDDRKEIILRLGESGHEQALETLLRVLHKETSSMIVLTIVRAIWVCLGKNSTIEWEKIDKKVADSLESSSPHVTKLSDLLKIYRNALTDSSEEHPNDVDKLIEILKKETYPLRRGLVAIGLGFIGDDAARKALLDIFLQGDIDEFVGWCSAEGLAQIVHDDVHQQVLAICEDKVYQEDEWHDHRARALYLLGWVGQQSHKDRTRIEKLLIQALKDPSVMIRGFAVQSIGRLGIESARKEIEQMLSGEYHTWLRRKLAQTLGKIGTQDSLEILKHEQRLEMARTRTLRRAALEISRRDLSEGGLV